MPRYSAEKRRSIVAQTILSLPRKESRALSSLDPAMTFFGQSRPCDYCGRMFTPKRALARFCNQRCSTRWVMSIPELKKKIYNEAHAKNTGTCRKRWLASGHPKAEAEKDRIRKLCPSTQPEVQAKISRVLKRMGHHPSRQGGNGRPTPIPQRFLWELLGEDWKIEHIVPTGQRCKGGLPTHFKIDIANQPKMIAIEVDGPSHFSKKSQEQDQRKEDYLASQGWTVLRFWNKDILNWINLGTPQDHYIFMILRSRGILPSA